MTVLEGIQKSAEFLAKKGVESSRLQAELLLAHLLKLPRMKLYLNFERALTPAETDALRELVRRRGQREPLQHITGTTSFCGFEIAVNHHVLIPRPETELLAEAGWNFLIAAPVLSHSSPGGGVGRGEEASLSRTKIPSPQPSPRLGGEREPGAMPGRAPTVLDFGTGSGCIAIAIALKSPRAQVYAADVSGDALALARQNAASHSLTERLQFFQGNGFAALPTDMRFDLIVSNPPYIPSAEIEILEPEVRDYDPRGALDGGPDGLDFYRRLAVEAGTFLKPAGKMMLEFGEGQAEGVKKIFEKQKWVVEAILPDYTRRERILVARR